MTKVLIKYVFMVFVLPVCLMACQELGFKKKISYPASVNSTMQASFGEAEKSYLKQDYDKALTLYQNFINGFEYNKLADESLYKIGKIHFIRSNWGGVLDAMNHLKGKTPSPLYKAKAGLLAAHASFKNTDFQGTLRWLGQTREADLPDKLKLRYFSLAILSGEQLGIARDKVDFNYLKLADVYASRNDAALEYVQVADIVKRSEVASKIDTWVVSPMKPETIPAWFSSFPNGYAKGFIEYKWGKVFYEAQNEAKARKKLSHFVSAYPKNRFVGSAKKLLEKLGQDVARSEGGDNNTIKVGVLLPFSGNIASYGDSTLKGIRCAAGQADGCSDIPKKFSDSFSVELIVKDAGSTPETIASQIEELDALNVSAIIGPMSASLADAAATKAQSLHIPVFPITQKTDLMKNGDYVFQMGFEVMTQMNLLVREARAKGVKSFAVFYPENAYGKEMAAGFVRATESAGGKVVTKVSYNPSGADLTPYAHLLKTNVSRFSMGTNDLGFGAVFVPDSFSSLPRILAAFEANSITEIPVLGTTAWNDPRLPLDALAKFPGSLYVDLFDTAKGSGLVPTFVSTMNNLTGHPPTSIEALGFDAMWAIRTAAKQQQSTDKEKIRDGLFLISNLGGVTGISGFKENQGPIVTPSILSSPK